jgi:hypothetical protein
MALDYSSYQTANPLSMAMQGFKDAGAIQAAKQKQAVGQQTFELNQMKVDEYMKAQAKKQEFQTALAGLGKNPSAQDYQRLMVQFPTLGATLKEPYEMLSSEAKQVKLTQATQVLAALKSNSPETATALLERFKAAAENSNDNASAAGAQALMDQIAIDPAAARDAAALSVAAAAGPEQFASIYEKISKVGAEAALQPGLIAKQDFELIKLGTDMGIPPEQTQKIIKSYRGAGLSPDTSENLLMLEAVAPGSKIYDPEKRYSASKDLRTEYNKRTGDLTGSRINYEKMLESAKIQAGLGDVALITAFMKMLDPGSTVRESEFATARDTAGLYASLENYLEKVRTGEFLSDSQRKVFTDLAGKYLEAAEKDGAKTRQSMEGIVDRLGLNPADVFVDVIEEAEAAAFPVITTQEEVDALPSGSVFIENGKPYRKP